VVSHSSGHGRWQFVYGEAAPRLRPLLAGPYLGYSESATSFLRRIEVANANAVLIVAFSPLYLIDPLQPAAAVECRAFVGGISDSHVITETERESLGLQVDLTPLGAYQLFGLPMSDTTNRVVTLDDIFGHQGRRLSERLQAEPTWEARFAVLDAFLCARLDRARAPSAAVGWAWDRLQETAGNASIADLAAAVGWSRKHLIERFREQVGMAPKLYARLLRFQRVIQLLKRGTPVRWADLALDCGYYDQAHFIRDFRQFAGKTPTDFQPRILPDSGGIIGD
jgi:AraC-like DNA-binding protein